MTDQVLVVLRVLLLALVYLFFARVLWAVWSEVRFPVARAGASTTPVGLLGGRRARARGGKAVVVLIEPRTRRGESFTLADSLRIGRDADNDVAIADDTFMSGHHARIEVRPEGTWLVDLDSTNGTFVNGQRVERDRSLRGGDRIQTGSAVLEVRL